MRWLSLIVFTVLAGCSGAPEQQPPRPAPSPSPTGSIPAELQGRYALTPSACTAGADATPAQVSGLLTVGPAAIAFGLDQQSVDSIAIRADRVVFDTTETTPDGATESRRYSFRPSADHRTLTRVELNRPDRVYTRCAD